MSDHYHYASDIQGVADQGHRHSARDVGAADEHDFDVLAGEMRHAWSAITQLERLIEQKDARIAELDERLSAWADRHTELQQQLLHLGELVNTVAQAAGQGRI